MRVSRFERGSLRRRVAPLAAAAVAVTVVGAAPAGAVPSGVSVGVDSSGKCLSVKGSSTAQGAPVVQYRCQGLPAQHWRTVPQASGGYRIVVDSTGKCLNVGGARKDDGAPVIQYTCGSGANERWKVRSVPESTRVQLVSENSGLCLDVQGGGTTDNAAVIQHACSTTSTSQRWYAAPAGPGSGPAPYVPNSAVAVGATTSGLLQFAYTDNVNGHLRYGRQITPGPTEAVTWSDISPGAAGFTGTPVVVELADGRMRVVAQGTDSDIWMSTRVTADGVDFGPLYDIGGASKAHAVAAKLPDGRLVMFVLDGQGGLWQVTQNGGTVPFWDWRSLGRSGLVGTPAVATVGTGIRIVGLTATGSVQTAVYGTDGSLSAWTNLGGSGYTGTPAVVIYPGSRTAIIARTADGTLTSKVQSNVDNAPGPFPAAWTSLGAFAASGQPTATFAGDRLVVVARGADDAVHLTTETGVNTGVFGAWTTASAAGDTAQSDPTAFALPRYTGNRSWAFVFRSAGAISMYVPGAPPSGNGAPTFIRHVLPPPPS